MMKDDVEEEKGFGDQRESFSRMVRGGGKWGVADQFGEGRKGVERLKG